MQRQVIFRDLQEQQAQDHTDIQDFTRQSFDSLVLDAVTASRRFSGFVTQKTAQVEVTVGAGRFYDAAGAVFSRDAALVQSMVTYLAAAASRIVSVSVYGVEVQTEVEERDFVVNVDTGAAEPEAVATQRHRQATLAFTAGAEAAEPQPPAIPANHVEIARIRVDAIQVISVTMMTINGVRSTENLDQRTTGLETFKGQIEPRVTSIGSDLARLSNQVAGLSFAGPDLSKLFRDMARVKELLEIPDDASDYGADRFLTASESDVNDVQSLGFDAKVEEGVRFAPDNEHEFELSIFSANDPNAAVRSGLLLPAHTDALKLAVATFYSEIGIAQYGFQTFNLQQLHMSRERIRYGSTMTVCTNNAWWKSGTYDPASGTFRKDGETFEVLDYDFHEERRNPGHSWVRLRKVWTDTYQEPYWAYVVTDHSITGAQIAQSFPVTNDMWLTRMGFFMTAKAAAEAVHVTLAEVINGVPDLNRVILQQTVPHGDLVTGDWTRFATQPTFLRAGKRYALVLTSNANHKFGMASGQDFVDGTFFYSTDGSYFQGDLTRDLMFELWGARFNAPMVTVELGALNLSGGMREIDILAEMVAPESTSLVFEVRPNGSGAWLPLDVASADNFAGVPPLCHFRARFVGTRDIQPAVRLTGSRVKLSRPKTSFTHISTPITLASASDSITVTALLEEFDETPHNFTLQLIPDGEAAEDPDTTVDEALDDLPDVSNRVLRTFQFNIAGGPITEFTLKAVGTTNSAANTFHWAERVHWAT